MAQGFSIRQAVPADATRLLTFLDALAAETDIDVPLEPGETVLSIADEEAILQEYAGGENSILLATGAGEADFAQFVNRIASNKKCSRNDKKRRLLRKK